MKNSVFLAVCLLLFTVMPVHAGNDLDEIRNYEKRLLGQSREIEAQNVMHRLTQSEYQSLRSRWQSIQVKLRLAKADSKLTAGERLDLTNAMNALAVKIKGKAFNKTRP